MDNEQHIAALQRRLTELEHDLYFSRMTAWGNPRAITPGDLELERWRSEEAAALRAAMDALNNDARRQIPAWMYLLVMLLVVLAMVLAGRALWLN